MKLFFLTVALFLSLIQLSDAKLEFGYDAKCEDFLKHFYLSNSAFIFTGDVLSEKEVENGHSFDLYKRTKESGRYVP